MKKLAMFLGIVLLAVNINAEQIKEVKEIKIYQVPLETYLTANNIKEIEKNGVLEKKKIIINKKNVIIANDNKGNQLILLFNNPEISNKDKINLTINALKKLINNNNSYNKEQIIKLINIIKKLNQ